MVQASRRDVDLIRATIGLIGERRSAILTERSKRAGISFVTMRLAGLPVKVNTLYDGPGHGLCTSRSPAVLAVAIRTHTRFALHPESNFPAVTAAGDHQFSS